jgi:hypothetical protein
MWRKASKCSAANCLEADGPWLKAAASNPSGNCLEAQFTAASACESNACVEAAETGGVVRVRDSKQNGTDGQVVLVFPAETWDNGRVIDFIPAVGTDQYMVLGVTETGEDAALFYTQGEVDAFRQGIEDDDFVLAGEVS